MKKFILLTLSIFLGVSSSLFLYRAYDTHINRSPTIRYSPKSRFNCSVDLAHGKFYHKATGLSCHFEPNISPDTEITVYEAIERNFSACPHCFGSL